MEVDKISNRLSKLANQPMRSAFDAALKELSEKTAQRGDVNRGWRYQPGRSTSSGPTFAGSSLERLDAPEHSPDQKSGDHSTAEIALESQCASPCGLNDSLCSSAPTLPDRDADESSICFSDSKERTDDESKLKIYVAEEERSDVTRESRELDSQINSIIPDAESAKNVTIGIVTDRDQDLPMDVLWEQIRGMAGLQGRSGLWVSSFSPSNANISIRPKIYRSGDEASERPPLHDQALPAASDELLSSKHQNSTYVQSGLQKIDLLDFHVYDNQELLDLAAASLPAWKNRFQLIVLDLGSMSRAAASIFSSRCDACILVLNQKYGINPQRLDGKIAAAVTSGVTLTAAMIIDNAITPSIGKMAA